MGGTHKIFADIDVDGEVKGTSLDLNGNAQVDGTITVGVDDTGYDVKFFGATSGKYMLWDESDNSLEFTDNAYLKLGTGADLWFYHDATDSHILNNTGNLIIQNTADDKDVIFKSDDGSGGVAEYFRLDGSAASSGNYLITLFPDDSRLVLGDGWDMQIWHNGTDNWIYSGAGNLKIEQAANDKDITFYCDNGAGGTATYFFLDGSAATHDGSATTALTTNWPDNSKITLGGSNDLQLLHNATNSYIQNYVGHLYINNWADDKDIIFQSDDGSGGVTAYLTLDGSTTDIELHRQTNLRQPADSEGLKVYGYDDESASSVSLYVNSAGHTTLSQTTDGSSGYLFLTAENYLQLSAGSLVYTQNQFRIYDAGSLTFGDSGDSSMRHDGSNFAFANSTGNVTFTQNTNDGDIIFQNDDGSGGTATYLTLDGGNTDIDFHKNTHHLDNVYLKIGSASGGDLQMYHNGSHSLISNQTGSLFIRNQTDDGDIIFQADDGSGGDATYITLDGSVTRTIFSQEARFTDSVNLKFGTDGDSLIFHDGADSVIRNSTGHVYFDNLASDKDIYFRGSDAGSTITALTLDMSAAGAAAFNSTVSTTGIILDGNTITGIDDSGEFTDNDAHIMTSAGVDDRISTRISGLTSNAGTVDTSGTPVDNDYAKFTDANTIEGRSASEVKTDLSLNNVENTAISTFAGTSNITTVGTIGTGTWQGTAIASAYLDSDTAHLSGTQTFSGAKTFSSLASFTMDGNTITGVDDSGEFTNDDAHIMTSAAIEDKILGYSYTANGLPTTGGTMSGAIAMGNQNITGAGTITGTTLTGTSLDINGSGDISGDLVIHGKITQSGVVDYERYGRSYTVNTNAPLPLLTSDGSALPTGGGYRVTGHIHATGTDQVSMAVFWNENGTWYVNNTFQGGASSNHVEFKLLDHGSGSVPTVTLESHTSDYAVKVYHERLALDEDTGTDNLRGYFGADSYLSWLESANALTVPGDINVGANYIGRDSTDMIDFSTDNQMAFRANNASRVTVDSAQMYPNASNSYNLGHSSYRWNNFYFGDGSIIDFNGDVTLTHSSNALTLAGGQLTVSGEVEATSLDINGNADISGNLTGVDDLTMSGNLDCTDVDASGTITGNGSGIDTINGSNISSGTVAAARVATLNQDTTGTAAIATTVTVADESSDTSCNVLFATAATGNLGPKSGTNLTFNSSSGILTATGFAGALTGNVTGNASGSSGSCTGNAATATEATSITATANNSANETVYLTFVDGATGTQGIETDTGLSYNPSSGALTTNSVIVGSGITHDGDANNKIAFTTDTQTFSCDGNESLILRGNAVNNEPLFEINGAGAGNQLNIGLLLKGVTNGNPIKMKMQAPPDGGGDAVGAGILSYEPDDDTFNIGQSTTHNSMAISINNSDQATMTNVVTLSGGFILDGNTITGVDDSGEFTNDDAHIMTSAGIEDKILGYGYTTNTGDATLSGTQTFSGAKTFSAAVTVSNSTASTSKTTGAVKVTGGVGIQGALNVGGDVTAFASSDERYKDNLQAITNPIDKVKSLTGYTFTWNDKHEQFKGNNDIGVVAQEVEKVLPEIVDTRDNGYKAVKYEKMVALLIEAVKDQQKQIDELKEKCNGCSR